MQSSTTKLILAVVLFGTWVGLVFAKANLPSLDTAPLVTAIQTMLAGLGVYHTMDTPAAPKDETPKEEEETK